MHSYKANLEGKNTTNRSYDLLWNIKTTKLRPPCYFNIHHALTVSGKCRKQQTILCYIMLVMVYNHSCCFLQYLPTYYAAHGKTYNRSCALCKKGHFQNSVLRVLRHSNYEASIRYTFHASLGAPSKI